MYYEILLVAYLVVAILLIGFVLIQQGKGADMGASFGAGGANTIFGSSGSGNFMTKTTAILATAFFGISLLIGGLTSREGDAVDEFENIEATQEVPDLPIPDNSQFPVSVEQQEALDETSDKVINENLVNDELVDELNKTTDSEEKPKQEDIDK